MNSLYASISVNDLILRGLIISLRSIMLLTSFMLVLLPNGEGAFYIIIMSVIYTNCTAMQISFEYFICKQIINLITTK